MEHMEIESHEGKKQDEEGHHHNNEVARLEEYKKFIDAKTALRQSNLNPERPDASHLRTLDSSIKRNTAVIKKLRVINDEQKDGLMEELKSVNLSKFVSEAVSYISEAKLRSADIQAAVQNLLSMSGFVLVWVDARTISAAKCALRSVHTLSHYISSRVRECAQSEGMFHG